MLFCGAMSDDHQALVLGGRSSLGPDLQIRLADCRFARIDGAALGLSFAEEALFVCQASPHATTWRRPECFSRHTNCSTL